ncbi:hypothetical protein ACGFX4_37775 [Kitasatospora sp. NPDC048365]|uniref:hypothetical protein n=1 Tax=Kitasatospora sp. NPDC048365 TaxID=3364050 RepID=UPI00371D5A9D
MVSLDRKYAFRLNTMDSYDAGLCRAVLRFVREREPDFVGDSRPLASVAGFSWPGFGFDVIGRVRPEAHRLFPKDPELNRAVLGIFPAYSMEISGFESAAQAAERFSRMLNPSNLGRGPSPYVLIRFDNPRTGAGTIGDEPVFVSREYALHELGSLEGVREAYLELWNYRNEKWRVSWDGDWIVAGSYSELEIPGSGLSEWLYSVIG